MILYWTWFKWNPAERYQCFEMLWLTLFFRVRSCWWRRNDGGCEWCDRQLATRWRRRISSHVLTTSHESDLNFTSNRSTPTSSFRLVAQSTNNIQVLLCKCSSINPRSQTALNYFFSSCLKCLPMLEILCIQTVKDCCFVFKVFWIA